MTSFTGKALRWELRDSILELTLDREPANEIGTAMLAELEQFVAAFPALAPETSACIITSARKHGFRQAPIYASYTKVRHPFPPRSASQGSAISSNAFTRS